MTEQRRNRPAPAKAPSTPSGVYVPRSTHAVYLRACVEPCFCQADTGHYRGEEVPANAPKEGP